MGELNFLHTTDTHGWLGSHLVQPDFDADWGDFISFVDLFKKNRLTNKQDLLVIDTGDKRDGNGLSDATSPSGIATTALFNEQDYDLLTLGNHELYNPANTEVEYYSTAMSHKFKNKYVCSNVDFVKEDGTIVPFGNKYLYLETPKNKIRILTLSFIFHFQKANQRARVTSPIEEIMTRDWFKEMLERHPENELDMLLIFGHVPITDHENHELEQVHEYLRKFYPNIIIQYFGGHSHIRDFVILDDKSSCLQSGRYSETVGFLSIDNVKSEKPSFFRRYINFSKRSFKFHSHAKSLDTHKGKHVSSKVECLRKSLGLNKVIGFVSKTYYMAARQIDSEENVYHMLVNKVLPRLKPDIDISSVSRFITINTGAVRYDLFKGPFTKDSEYIVLPFPNKWLYLEVPLYLAMQVEEYLNHRPSIASLGPPQSFALSRPDSCPLVNDPSLSEGYVTRDDFGCNGDDTPRNSQNTYKIPSVVQLREILPSTQPNDNVHFIFYSFVQSDIIQALNSLLIENNITDKAYDATDCKASLRWEINAGIIERLHS